MTAGGALLVLGARERVVVRGGRGPGRAPAGVLVRGLQAAELEVELRVPARLPQAADLPVPAVGAPLTAGQYAAVKTQYAEVK
jgi:hypothetical protein